MLLLLLLGGVRHPQRGRRTLVSSSSGLAARRQNKRGGGDDNADNDLDRWYDAVDAQATPDQVFWEEMERQSRLGAVVVVVPVVLIRR